MLSLKLLISSPELLFFGAGSLFFEGGYIFLYGGTPGGGTLIFSHIRRLGLFFWVQTSEFQYFWGFQKNEYFFDMKILRIFFGGSSQNWASFRVISMHFRVFFKVKGTELGYFFGLLKFQIFFLDA